MKRATLFVAWAVVGFVASFGLLYGFTPIGPLFLALGWLAFRCMPTVDGERRPEAFGALAGFGAFSLFLAASVDDELPFVGIGTLAVALAAGLYVMEGQARCAGNGSSS